jgi:hypothetical protein
MSKQQQPLPFYKQHPFPENERTSITSPIPTGISRSGLDDSQTSISPMAIGVYNHGEYAASFSNDLRNP